MPLPSHLSYKSALVLLPPSSIVAPIESIRQKHDKHFRRWPPHINLIYPFLAAPSQGLSLDGQQSEQNKTSDLLHNMHSQGNASVSTNADSLSSRANLGQRLTKVAETVPPFRFLRADPPGVFNHSKQSATVWLDPINNATPSNGDESLSQASLQTSEFSECNEDTRPFTPHLSVGQASGSISTYRLRDEAQRVIETFGREKLDEGNSKQAPIGGFEWHVDTVHIIERSGFKGRFKIVGSFKLSDDTSSPLVSGAPTFCNKNIHKSHYKPGNGLL
ncbi:uncharacterized protein BDZ99DRAFT_376368 [Mytilinidion resinicola]|uniref:2, 3 cyclic phosphodiesterase n=1 Tax=Mytilinidion resinicola TaxID=574789 RepID=A0A6A6Z4V5_9PEZI|nr:uncharacterized protein BDZ99DRAFT_376368 [Mytilinidion resinicola]KAF2815858.1 hypothetical protein BDZ99DRAFT_376368 [Mytilinidion resinicola]